MTADVALKITDIKSYFPALNQKVNGKPLVFLDTAASAQKPTPVIDAISETYQGYYANVHRGVYTLSDQATTNYENTRDVVANFINAQSSDEIIYTKGTTESINLVAESLARSYLQSDDEIIVSEMEHHSNIVPWQLVAERIGLNIRVIPVFDNGELDMAAFGDLLSEKTKMVAVTQCSNVLGTINPIDQITEKAHRAGALVLVDGAQSIVHQSIDVQAMNCDFFAFSSHKLYGPTGVGFLYGKYHLLDQMPPYQGGGDMIDSVSFEGTSFHNPPLKFEAGTTNIVGITAFKHAIDFVQSIGMDVIAAHEQALLNYATDQLNQVEGLTILGSSHHKAAVITFIIEGLHPNDLGVLMDLSGVAVRTGHHCCHPLMARFGVSSTVRASFALYNTYEDVDVLIESIKKAKKMLGR